MVKKRYIVQQIHHKHSKHFNESCQTKSLQVAILHSLASVFPWEHLHLHNCVHGRSADLQLHLFVLQSFLQPHFTRSRKLSATSAIVIQTGCHWFSFFCQPNKEAEINEPWSSKDVTQIPVWYTLLFICWISAFFVGGRFSMLWFFLQKISFLASLT